MAIERNKFLSEWFSESEGQIEIRLLPSGKQGFFSIEDFQGIDDFASKNGQQDIYFGVATRNGAGGTKANVIHIPGVWTEIDFKDVLEEEADKLLAECPLQPTFVILSGGGYHLYWQFREPTDNIQIVENINRQLVQFFDSDPVYNIDRILRLPDTINHKYTPWRPVKVLIHDQARQYNQSDFEEHFPPLKDVNGSGEATNPPGWENEVVKGVAPGHRRPNLAKEAGRLITIGLIDEEILPVLLEIDKKNTPPVGKPEVIKTLKGIRKTHDRNHPPQEDPLKFPDIIAGVAGEFAELYSGYLEVPQSFFYMSYLACLGSILAKSLKLKTILDTQSRLYLLLLGESADDRKSTAIKQTIKFFKELLKQDFNVCWGANSAEGLQKVFNKDSKVFSGSTVLMAIDELKQLLSKCKIEGSTLLPMITTLFESNIYEAHTKNSDIYLKDAHLSLISASTIETYETVWDSSFTAIGFNNRLWIVPGATKKQFSFPGEIPEDKMSPLRLKTVEILRLVGERLELDITPEGKELFQNWYMNLESSIHTKRLDGYALRFMGLLAVNELKQEIGVDIVEKAITLCDWQLKVRQLYDPVDADNVVAKMEERIRRYLRQEPLTERELKRKLHTIIERSGIFCFTRAKNNLQTAKDIYFKKDNKAVLIHLSE